ncbi:hypothetical protein [Arthrobacter sp. NyZ413]|uniref:hypothetical protein n=1 Tax=Arthrobacter sp. NyZ413 TaxID=3144669 RepID=UPI003BF90AA6
MRPTGIVVRPTSSEGVLLRLVETPAWCRHDVTGLSYLQIDDEGSGRAPPGHTLVPDT